jgi:hypothetical protein
MFHFAAYAFVDREGREVLQHVFVGMLISITSIVSYVCILLK